MKRLLVLGGLALAAPANADPRVELDRCTAFDQAALRKAIARAMPAAARGDFVVIVECPDVVTAHLHVEPVPADGAIARSLDLGEVPGDLRLKLLALAVAELVEIAAARPPPAPASPRAPSGPTGPRRFGDPVDPTPLADLDPRPQDRRPGASGNAASGSGARGANGASGSGARGANGASASGASGNGASGNGASGNGASGSGARGANGASASGASGNGASGNGASGSGARGANGALASGASGSGASGSGARGANGASASGASGNWASGSGASGSGARGANGGMPDGRVAALDGPGAPDGFDGADRRDTGAPIARRLSGVSIEPRVALRIYTAPATALLDAGAELGLPWFRVGVHGAIGQATDPLGTVRPWLATVTVARALVCGGEETEVCLLARVEGGIAGVQATPRTTATVVATAHDATAAYGAATAGGELRHRFAGWSVTATIDAGWSEGLIARAAGRDVAALAGLVVAAGIGVRWP